MVIAETSIFTRQIQELLDDESYRLLQLELVTAPEKGDLIKEVEGSERFAGHRQGRESEEASA